MFDIKEWLKKMKTPEGITTLLAVVLTLVGWILILSGPKVFSGEFNDKYKHLEHLGGPINLGATLMFITVVINLIAYLEDQPILITIAAGLLYAYSETLLTATHLIPRIANRVTFVGFIFAWIGVFGSFIGPILRRDKGVDFKNKEVLLAISIFVLDLVGVILIWIGKHHIVQMVPITHLYIGLFFLAAVLLSSQSAQFLTMFLASTQVYYLFVFFLSSVKTIDESGLGDSTDSVPHNHPLKAAGFFLSWISMILMVLFLAFKYCKVKSDDYLPLLSK